MLITSLGLAACPLPDATEPTSASEPTEGDTATSATSSPTGSLTSSTGGDPTSTGGDPTDTGDSPLTGDVSTATGDVSTTDDATAGDTTTTDGASTSSTSTESGSTDGDSTDSSGSTGGDGGVVIDIDVEQTHCSLKDTMPNFGFAFEPSAVVAADFDGDGKEDIAARAVSTSLSPQEGLLVIRNLGGGEYAPPKLYPGLESIAPTVSGDWSLVAADIDADGRPDIAATDHLSDTVKVLRNLGDGSFGPAVSYQGILMPESIVAGDFDGDAAIDLAVLAATNSVAVLTNQGDGTFALEPAVVTGTDNTLGFPLVAADVDGDGKSDLAIASEWTDGVVVLRSTGEGGFASAYLATDKRPTSVIADDLNGDGTPDLAVVDGNGTGFGVLLNLGDGTFGPENRFLLADQFKNQRKLLRASDLDADGRRDLIVGQNSHAHVFRNEDGGQFAYDDTYPLGWEMVALATLDIDTDGRVDILASNRGDRSLQPLLQRPDGTFEREPTTFPIGLGVLTFTQFALGDFGDDDATDIAVIADKQYTLTNQGDGSFTITSTSAHSGDALRTADVDGDGMLDLVICDSTTDVVRVLRNQGGGTFAATVYPAPSLLNCVGFDLTNLDGEPAPDVVGRRDGGFFVLPNQGDGTFGAAIESVVSSWGQLPAITDVDGDGAADIVVIEGPVDNTHTIKLLRNDGGGKFASETLLTGDTYHRAIVGADLDGDGDQDLVVAGTYVTHVLHNDGAGHFALVDSQASPLQAPWPLYVADVNGDGASDVLAPGVNNEYGVLLNVDGKLGPVTLYPANSTSFAGFNAKFAPADVDGDGVLDVAFGGNALGYALGDGAGAFGPSAAYTSPSMKYFAAQDLDGDARADFVYSTERGVHVVLSTCP